MEMHPLQKLPEDMWRMILDNLKEPRDLINCQIASNLFREILRPSQCSWLFSKIFPLCAPYLRPEEMLICRETGRVWKRVVDSHLEYRNELFAFDATNYDYEYNYLQYPPHRWDSKCGITQLYDQENIERYRNIIQYPVWNSVAGRFMEINLKGFGWENTTVAEKKTRDNSEKGGGLKPCNYIKDFLRSGYGQYVQHFQLIKPEETGGSVTNLICLLRMLLGSLPNLKTLEISILEQVKPPELGTVSI